MGRLAGRPPRRGWLLLLALPALLAVGSAPAQEGAAKVELEKLLKLPDSLDYAVEQRGGATRAEWLERFQEARASVEEAEAALRRSQAELEEVASSSGAWQVAPPGVSTPTTEQPLDYRLRQDIRRKKREVEAAERRLQDLTIEANLAGVPDDWRE